LKIQHLDWLLRTAKVQLKKLGAANWNMFGIGADPEFLLSTDRKSAPAEQFNVTVKASVLSLSNGLVFLHSNNKPKALSSAMPTKPDISVKRPQSATVTIVRVVEASDQRNRKIPRTAKPGDVRWTPSVGQNFVRS